MVEILKTLPVLMAEDDPDDRLLTYDAFVEAKLENTLIFVNDGEELMDYLRRRGKFSNSDVFPQPALILLDLNMPRKDGREALQEIKHDPCLRHIPVAVLTTSKAEDDIQTCYALGANSYIIKPETFSALVTVARDIGRYWLELVELPTKSVRGSRIVS